MLGVVRRASLRSIADSRGPWPAPWSVNCRVDDPFDRRLRGGSRPGLTKFVSDDMGTTIADIASINTSSTTGTSEVLFVLVDSTVKTVENGTTTTRVAYLTDSSGNILTDASSNQLVASTVSAPSTGFLVTGQQYVFAVGTSAIVKMDPKTGQADNLAASSGTVPTGSTFGAVYRDRLCLSGKDNAIYMSRLGDYTDWNFGAYFDDTGRAIPFQLSLSADVGAKPTAMIACKDDYLICASDRTLWIVRGDPSTGSLERISETVGIVDSRAWCKIDDSIVFLAKDGLYQVGADGSGLSPLTTGTIPDELRSIDTSTTTVSIGYEHDRLAFHIFLRTSGGSDTHWVYELASNAFQPVRFQNTHSPLAVCQHQGELLLAGSDGFIRKIGGDDDDGSNIESHVILGPLQIGSRNEFGRLINMHAMLAAGSGTVTWRIVPGDTAETAADNAKLAIEAFQAGSDYSSYYHSSGTWTAGRAVMSYPRTRAVWCCLWLQSTAKWAYEGATIETMTSGKWRGG